MSDAEWTPPDEFEEYRLVRLLGRGAMGQVYLAHDSLLDRPVAVKFVRAAEDPAVRARVFDEARAIARLQHPNVVAIYRVAELSGRPYLVSEYVRGRSLDQIERPVSGKLALQLAIDLARGLAAAHRSGLLHRDVKPANAIVTDDGRGKLLDFGLARVVDANQIEVAVAPPRERTNDTRLPVVIDETQDSPMRPAVSPTSSSRTGGSDFSLGVGSPLPGHEAGTPLYMAPELWRGETATRRSDLYSLGVLLYELLHGTAPHRGIPMAELGEAIQNHDIPRLGTAAPGVEPALAAIVDRLVERDAGARFPSADALLVALEECAAPTTAANVPDGNPYRGLAAFESTHGSLFYGRRSEIRELIDRVTDEPFVVVGGDSGIGKSSVCRAGVLPWLVEHAGWSRVDVVPGRHPVRSLAAALAAWSRVDEATLAELVRDTPEAVGRAIRQNLADAETKLLLFVDQLEELMTFSEAAEAKVFATALAALAVRTPSVRVIATARSDFLSRLATLPGLGDEMGRGLYFLRPLTGERVREAIVRPAAAKGVTFEFDELVDTLVEQTAQAPGGLPLLQFTLAELWDARDVEGKTIRSDALVTLGGVEGALARHADRLLAGLDAHEREAARRILLRLVTADGTRARRTEAELLTDGTERNALEVLVRGRIVVANDAQHGAYELAHEALLTSWSTFLDWRRRGAAEHAVRARIEQAAAAWQRMGHPRDVLWRRRQLAETAPLDLATLAAREQAFLAASRRAIVKRRAIGAAVVVVLVAAAVIVGLVIRARARRELESVIAGQMELATREHMAARGIAEQRDAVRRQAFALFDTQRWPEGEAAWDTVEELASEEAARYRAATVHLDTALSLDPRDSVRAQLADLLLERLERAESYHHTEFVDELAGRLAAYDDGRRGKALVADVRVELDVKPPGARISLERGTAREPVTSRVLELSPGHVVFVIEAPGHATARLPVLLVRGKPATLSVALPPAGRVPANMIYVPAGTFLFGSTESTDLRRGFLNSPPLHEVTTGAYLIGRNEVTFGEWIEFLDDVSPDERKLRTPSAIGQARVSSIELTELAPKRWRLSLTPTTHTYVAETGQRLVYQQRARRADQDWTRFPVTGMSFDDANAYAAWLDRTKRLPGARLCDEHEWERAARGADGRTYPTGATLAPDDANFDLTYGRESLAFGPDEVGSHPRSRSPVGADDMAGNAWEWTRSVEIAGRPVVRGGGWYNASLSSRSPNREGGEPTQRNVLMGFRLCASAH